MKVSSRPISSPSRTEKFPPPLMRFLRINVGSKSRGRSRASPMFIRKKNTAIETQEPSSPKVTCIGQVRVRRSSKPNRTRRSRTPANPPCFWVRNFFLKNLKPRSFLSIWRKWVVFFRFGYCRKVDLGDDSSKKESIRRTEFKAAETEDEDEEGEAEEREDKEVLVSSSPPKNAFLLTRCRSAPSLSNRFWGSPSETGEGGDEREKGVQKQEKVREIERPISENEPNSGDSAAESRIDEEMESDIGILEGFEGSINGGSREENSEELRKMEGGSVGPVILTRCKSEPARIGERISVCGDQGFVLLNLSNT